MTGGVPFLLFADIETSGLNERQHFLLEVGFRVVDSELETLAEASWAIPYRAASLVHIQANAGEGVSEMHTKSGLWRECNAGEAGLSVMVARDSKLEWMTPGKHPMVQWLIDNGAKGLPLAGSTVGFDRRWLNHWLPGFEGVPHYRSVDVSSLKVLVAAWRPAVTATLPVPLKAHRALPDLDDTIGELRHYRLHLGLDLLALAAGDFDPVTAELEACRQALAVQVARANNAEAAVERLRNGGPE